MNLAEALNPPLPALIAIVGAGGKTTALFQLAQQLPGYTWATTTTHLGTDQLDNTDQHFILCEPGEVDVPMLLAQKSTLITGLFTPDDRVHGPSDEVMVELVGAARKNGVSLIVEADGARSHPLKAPAAHEPVIPGWAETVIVVVGLSVLGKPFTEEWVHRPEQFEALTGLRRGEEVDIASISRMLLHPDGGLKNIPGGAQKVVLSNQVETDEIRREVESAAPGLLQGGFDKVIIAALRESPDDLIVFPKD